MRELVQRHRGILPLDTVESIWRVIISTFTYVQAPFSRACRRLRSASPRCGTPRAFISASRCLSSRISARRPRSRRWRNRRATSALVSATSSRTPWWIALEADGAPKIIARLPFLERADHPAALPVFVVSRVADDAMVTEVEMLERARLGLERRRRRARCAPLAEIVAVPDTAFDGAALLVSDRRADRLREDQDCADRSRRLGALFGPRRQPRNALYGALERVGQRLKTPPAISGA